MASTTITPSLARTGRPVMTPEQERAKMVHEEYALLRFFVAAAVALLISAIHGVIVRLPDVNEWIRYADYGGHMLKNTSHTHITIVGAGTISLTALIYYIFQRVTGRNLYSTALTNVSFWCTLVGVFGFYGALTVLGYVEGNMVHQGWDYYVAKDYLGAWHKVPIIVFAATMGVGYWTFVTNVIMSYRRWEKEVKAGRASNPEGYVLKFFVMSAIGLLIGTVQGVYQVMPWSVDWLLRAGPAGRQIDPASHAHMNLVGGVITAFMGFAFYFLPRITGRQIYSVKLANISFYTLVIGVFGFWASMATLGFVEGNQIVYGGLTYQQARENVGIWHPLPVVTSAVFMAIGFWTFIANVFLTAFGGKREKAAPDNYLTWFILISVTFLFMATVQGVMQVLPVAQDWLTEAGEAGEMITPLAHAQLNIIGSVILLLCALMYYIIPRIVREPVASVRIARLSLGMIAFGALAQYVVLLAQGIYFGTQMSAGFTFEEVRARSIGALASNLSILISFSILAVGYVIFMFNVFASIGYKRMSAYFADRGADIRLGWNYLMKVNPRAQVETEEDARRRALIAAIVEFAGGCLGAIGIGWLLTGRELLGFFSMLIWMGGFWTTAYVVIGLNQFETPFMPVLVVPVLLLSALSATGCYITYLHRALLPEEDLEEVDESEQPA